MRGALLSYRVMAYVVGTLLIVLICVGVPLKYLSADGSDPQQVGRWITEYLGITHGFLYMGFLVVAANLSWRARFPIAFTVTILVLGTVPFLSFVAERMSTRRVRAQYLDPDPSAAPT